MALDRLIDLEWSYLKDIGAVFRRIDDGVWRIFHPLAPSFDELNTLWCAPGLIAGRRWKNEWLWDGMNRVTESPLKSERLPGSALPEAWLSGQLYWLVGPRPDCRRIPELRIEPAIRSEVKQDYIDLACQPFQRWRPHLISERLAICPWMASGDGRLVGRVAYWNSIPVGYCDSFMPADKGESPMLIENLWVDPGARGRGIATQLASAGTCSQIFAIVDAEAEALNVYFHWGFTVAGRQTFWSKSGFPM